MYTPDARQQWVGWHSRIVGERGWTGTYWEGYMDVFFGGGHGRIKGVKDVLRREVWCIVRGGQGCFSGVGMGVDVLKGSRT